MYHRFLVSTTKHLLAVDPESHEFRLLDSNRGLYFGLAQGADDYCTQAPKHNGRPYCSEERRREEGSILVFDRSFRLVDELRPPFVFNIHGITVAMEPVVRLL